METISNTIFEGESVNVDHKHFMDCTFNNCILEYSGHSFTLERTQLTNCRYVFFGLARGTVHFLQCIGLLPEIRTNGSKCLSKSIDDNVRYATDPASIAGIN